MLTGFENFYWIWSMPVAAVLLLLLYIWHRNAVRRQVSAISLWDKPEAVPKSGTNLRLRRLPWDFWVLLAVLLLLALSAMTPFALRPEAMPPLAVVLDDSYSMSAIPQKRVLDELERVIAGNAGRRVIFILAGEEPAILSCRKVGELEKLWQRKASAGKISKAVSLARTRLKNGEILIVTDHAPDYQLPADTGYLSLGNSVDNCAIVNCRMGEETILVETANFGKNSASGSLKLNPMGIAAALTLAPGERHKTVLKIPKSAADKELTVVLDMPDAVKCDNEWLLLPEKRTPVYFAFDPSLPRGIRPPLERVLDRLSDFAPWGGEPEICFGGDDMPMRPMHRFFWHTGDKTHAAASRLRPEVAADSPLTRGLVWGDCLWSSDPRVKMPGTPLIRRGNTVLFSVVKRIDGFYDFHWHMAEGSNPGTSADWPALFWNMAEFIRSERAGVPRANYRTGEVVRCKLPPEENEPLSVVKPDGRELVIPVVRRTGHIAGLPAGVTTLKAGKNLWKVSVSGNNASESDLSNCAPYRKKGELNTGSDDYPRLMLGIYPALLAALLLGMHWYFINNGERKNG